MKTRKLSRSKTRLPKVPSGWQTSDQDERNRRIRRGMQAEGLRIRALERSLAPFGRYLVSFDDRKVEQGYEIEFRGFAPDALNTCSCPDHRINGLGTCKHIEALRHALHRKRKKRPVRRITEILIDRSQTPPRLMTADLGDWRATRLPAALTLLEATPAYTLARAQRVEQALLTLSVGQRRRFRLAASLAEQMEKDREKAKLDRRMREIVGRKNQETIGLKMPLYPYQRDGMLHLLTRRRAILADEMGLGKTVQAIAACALLARLGLISRVLVVSPASLKSEWEEQISLFTDLPVKLVEGAVRERREAYASRVLFTLTKYEQILRDHEKIEELLAPEVIVLDEAQRIKNWKAKTAEAIKRLSSDYAFVLTGTPLENRIDEIYSIMQIVDPSVLGPLFRFNRAYYVLNERGAPEGYKNLDRLHAELQPYILRRTKSEVEGDLPPCSVRTLMVPMSEEQRDMYAGFEAKVARLMSIAKRRALLPDESKRLHIALGCMRMSCDSGYILDKACHAAPKLDAFEPLLAELVASDHKLIVFSEWTRMLELLQKRLEARGVDYALHTGSVPQKKRRIEINRFKQDPGCRVFLSSESGGAGLNLQVADVVVNLDLPWNPAKLAQRIARAWRKHQTRSVQVMNFVAENTIEEGMLTRLEAKQRLADGVLSGGIARMDLPSGRGALVSQIENVMNLDGSAAAAPSCDKKSNGDQPAAEARSSLSDALATADALGKSTLQDLLNAALERFNPVLRRVDLVKTDKQRTLFVGVVAEHEEARQWFDDALSTSGSQQTDVSTDGWQIHITAPEFLTALFDLSGSGMLGVLGQHHLLIDDGQCVADKELLDRLLTCDEADDVAAREEHMLLVLGKIIEPHLQALQAAGLLLDNGFTEQADALAKHPVARIEQSLRSQDEEHEWPEPLRYSQWQSSPPSVTQILTYASTNNK
ncbi:MAG: DEAD/DEAH box helicase [Granulosicoccus sp.]